MSSISVPEENLRKARKSKAPLARGTTMSLLKEPACSNLDGFARP